MNLFSFQHGSSKELEIFPHVKEVGLCRSNTVQLNSFVPAISDELRIYYIVDGKFEWTINQALCTLYPGDVALVLPGWEIGGANSVLEIGTVFRLFIQLDKVHGKPDVVLGRWSGLTGSERLDVTNALLRNHNHILKIKEAADILYELGSEIAAPEIGHIARVNHLIDALLILIARQSTRQLETETDFSRTLTKFEQTLRKTPAHQWTVEEMAALFGLGTTAFTEKIKSHTGFSPLNYLINIRISEAIRMLQERQVQFTEIALETGFYSSQHFSTTFKKLTGYTPGEFRKRNFLQPSNQRSTSFVAD
jgi:AraC-like DNA-binding protein